MEAFDPEKGWILMRREAAIFLNHMPTTRALKEDIIRDAHEKAERAKVTVFLNFHGVKTQDMNKLRVALRKLGADITIIKKTLLKRVLSAFGTVGELPRLEGEIAVAFGYEEASDAAKAIKDFAKKNDNLKIVGGIVSGQYMLAQAMKQFADIPPREVLLAQLAGMLAFPMTGFVRVLSGPARSLVGVINQIRNVTE
ncbi:MAG: 50S ribosomal protein L10 [Candidatus Niyogibacteria bacterium]|nr:50S ribosomal protein L10 [Candidatus Niyogibacteria bacterium]